MPFQGVGVETLTIHSHSSLRIKSGDEYNEFEKILLYRRNLSGTHGSKRYGHKLHLIKLVDGFSLCGIDSETYDLKYYFNRPVCKHCDNVLKSNRFLYEVV